MKTVEMVGLLVPGNDRIRRSVRRDIELMADNSFGGV